MYFSLLYLHFILWFLCLLSDSVMPVDIHSILISSDDCLRERGSTLLHLMAQVCPDSLNAVWNETLRCDIEALDYDSCVAVRNVSLAFFSYS